jgi:acetyltransferase-like isoleucine patch superfamily enzyme
MKSVLDRQWRRAPWKIRYEYGQALASEIRKLLVRATHTHCRVEFDRDVYAGPGFALWIPHRGTFVVGEGVKFRRGFVCEISEDGRVEIGAHTTFTSHTLIQCTTSITIGDHCDFGQSTLIVDGNHRFRDPDKFLNEQGYDFRPVKIGRGATITTKCTIVADIGERAFIAANSVVVREIPPYCLAAGSPAKVREYFGHPDRRPVGVDV